MRQGGICMLIAALVLQLAGGVVAGGAEPLAMTTQETIRTVAVSGVPTALMRGARLPERMPSFHTDAACHLADSWQSWSGMVWFSSPDGEHISKPLLAGTITAVSYTHLDVYKRQGYGKIGAENRRLPAYPHCGTE